MIKKFFKSQSLSVGLAMFSMFFGAGNIIFPLAVGEFAGDKNFFALSGLILTAAVMPIAGVIAMLLFNGETRAFFGRLGRIPGFILALLIISLLGPLGSTPRCIALSYTTLKSAFFDISPIFFSFLSCTLIFFLAARKNYILTILGWILTPLLLLSLLLIIVIGFAAHSEVSTTELSKATLFMHGLIEGYNTMDLLAAFFFSSTIIQILKMRKEQEHNKTIKIAFKASLIGAFLLALVYVGFSYLAAFHGASIGAHGKDELLARITLYIAGPSAGLLVCVIVTLACLTTAIALITAFTDFIQKEVFKERIRYEIILLGALALTFFVSTFEFTGISSFLNPILQICYPGLILLTFLNILNRLKNFEPVKVPVFLAFSISALYWLLK